MKNSMFSGTGVALVTPFKNDQTIDFDSLQKLVNNVIENNVDYLVVMGTTAESATLNSDEKRQVLKFVLEIVNERKPVVFGIGGNNTSQIIENISDTDFSNISAVLSVTPYYNKPNQRGIYEHYMSIASSSPVPIILYNVPGRTSTNIEADTCLRLARDNNKIIGVKEASGNFSQIMKILRDRPEGFLVISGDDNLTFPLIPLGADGVISVTANAFPSIFTKMVYHAQKGNYFSARKCHFDLMDVIDLLFAEGNPAGVKAALNILGICENNLRLPLTTVSRTTYLNISHQVSELRKKAYEL